jgi:hypothetical protein
MDGINTFSEHLSVVIEDAKKKHFIGHLKNENGDTATWESKAWVYSEKGKSLKIAFVKNYGRGSTVKAINKHPAKYLAFPSPIREVLMLYSLRIINQQNIALEVRKNRFNEAKKFAQSVEDLEGITDRHVNQYAKALAKSTQSHLNSFLAFLNEYFFEHNSLRKIKIKRNEQTGAEVEESQKGKMADETSIAALGCILYEVIPPEKGRWSTAPLASQREAFVCTMSALALSSPNRAVAEQTVLDAQRLQSHSVTENSEKKTVYYLDWKGSKGYKNNENHILEPMSECVERCLDYMIKATEPNRVLSRFYANPQMILGKLLSKQDCDSSRWEQVNPDLKEPTNMVVLGYLLGLYDDKTNLVQVVPGTEGASYDCSRSRKWFKSIWMLRNKDKLKITKSSLASLIGTPKNSVLCKSMAISGDVTLKEFQDCWINQVNKTHPVFPEMRNNTKDGVCDARTMLFALSRRQLARPGTMTSPFMLASPQTLGEIFPLEIGGRIFINHGFSREFRIAPHQFRHYINHSGVESNIPKLIMNLWSGRKDPTQIVHYVHTSAADQASTVSDIMFNEKVENVEQAKQHIRVLSQEEYEGLTGIIASETSSGVCTQQLTVTPCSYLNDFNTQCVLCSKSCHIAHNEDAIALLRKDLTHQNLRLDQVANSNCLNVSRASQDWYKTHGLNTAMLEQLLELMTDKKIEKGSLIRLLTEQNQFRVTNLKTKQIDTIKLSLPDIEKELDKLLNDHRSEESDDTTINDLLELI